MKKRTETTTSIDGSSKNMSFNICKHVIHERYILPKIAIAKKALPINNAVFVHALTHGKDTMPSCRAIQSKIKYHTVNVDCVRFMPKVGY